MTSEAELLHADGLALWRSGDLDRALETIGRAVDLDPQSARIRTSFGAVLSSLGASEAAAASWRTALALDPSSPEALINLGNVNLGNAAPDDETGARRLYRRALAVDPAHVGALGNLGALAERNEEEGAALRLYARALSIEPAHARLWANLGTARHWRADLLAATRAFDRALILDAGLPGVRFDRAVNRLLRGDWARGFADYEARWENPGHARLRLALPPWRGEDPDGKRLLLWAEQGQGDALQFLRFVPHLRARGARVTLLVSRRLVPLMREFPGIAAAAIEAPPPAADLAAPLMSLPFLLGIGAQAPALASRPYLSVPPAPRLGDGRPCIGLVWAGNPGNRSDRRRSLTLDRLAPLLACEDLRFISLQFGERASDVAALGLAHRIETIELGDFRQTASIAASLDLVVTVDTAMAHLAGAMGRETWVLLSHVPDWRWGIAGETTPWYPSLRLFRQKRQGDWESAIAPLLAALRTRFP